MRDEQPGLSELTTSVDSLQDGLASHTSNVLALAAAILELKRAVAPHLTAHDSHVLDIAEVERFVAQASRR